MPAGMRIGALEQPHELVGAVSVALRGRCGRRRVRCWRRCGRGMWRSGAVYALRYRLRLVRGDRWYVAAVNQTTRKEG